MFKIEKGTKIIMTKVMPEDQRDYIPMIEKVGRINNYFITNRDYFNFKFVLEDFGIFSIGYYSEDPYRKPKGCNFEIRISSSIIEQNFTFYTKQDVDVMRYRLFRDACHGSGNIFKRQVNPKKPEGFIETRDGSSIDISRAIFRKGGWPDENISEYLSRLFYNDPYAHFADLISAFKFINDGLGGFFNFIVEE